MKLCLECKNTFETQGWTCPACGYRPGLSEGYPVFASDLSTVFDGFDEELFSLLAKVEPGHFWFETRNKLIIWTLRQCFPNAETFLEIGCGTGFVLSGVKKALPNLKIAGSDIFIEGLSFANDRIAKAALFQMDARRIPFEMEFDVIGAFDVLEHIEEDEIVLQELFRAVKPGGGIILTVPQHPFLWSHFDDVSHHRRRYTRLNLLQKVELAGFKVVYSTSFMTFLFPLLLVSRLHQRRPPKTYNIRAELEKSKAVNFSLMKVLNLELKFIKSGLSFPFGGSRLVVAKK